MQALVDSGFRRGTDTAKALCMGAQSVWIGRLYIWGLGAFGQPGVERVLELLRIELRASCSRSARHQSSISRRQWCGEFERNAENRAVQPPAEVYRCSVFSADVEVVGPIPHT